MLTSLFSFDNAPLEFKSCFGVGIATALGSQSFLELTKRSFGENVFIPGSLGCTFLVTFDNQAMEATIPAFE